MTLTELSYIVALAQEQHFGRAAERCHVSQPTLSIAVKNADGTSTEWVMTMGSATALAQRGIGRTGENALHNGDAIKIRFRPAKDGSPLGFLLLVTMPDGRVIQVAAPNATE